MKKIALAFLMSFSAAAWAQFKPAISVPKMVTTIHVNKNYTFKERFEVLKKIETGQGIALLGEQKISYNSAHENVRVIEAYTLQPDGKKVFVDLRLVRTQDDGDGDGASIYSEQKVKVIIFSNLAVGSQTYYAVETHQHTPDVPGQFDWFHYFSPHRSYGEVVVNFSHDPSVKVRINTLGMKGGPVKSKSLEHKNSVAYRYTFTQEQAYPSEPNMVSRRDFAPHIAASTYVDYAAVGKAYHKSAAPMAMVTPEINKLAQSLTQGAGNDTDKVRAIYNWVARNIRYLGVYSGSGGFIPQPAHEVLKNRYGDCKDHAALLGAMLKAVGIDSSPALINSGKVFSLPELPTSIVFDHVITYVPTLDLMLDATSRFTPMGTLHGGMVDKPVVITATGEMKRTPVDSPEKDRTFSQVSLKMRPNGSFSGTSSVTQTGYHETSSRGTQYSQQHKPKENYINTLLERFGESGSGKIQTPDPLDLNVPWVLKAEFELEPTVNRPGRAALTIPVGLTLGEIKSYLQDKPPKERRFPSVCDSNAHEEIITLEFPPETRISDVPKRTVFAEGPLRYESSYKLEGHKLTVERSFSAKRTSSVCSEVDDRNWERFINMLRYDMQQQIFIE